MSIYLYIKQCKHCGLKYFGKTINENIDKYLGSGHYWKRHIKVHGRNNVITEQIWKFDDQIEATKFALKFSEDNNIVESRKWANIIPEDGKDGNSSAVITEDLRNKFRRANTGKNNPMYGSIWITNGIENKIIKGTADIPLGWKKGRHFNEEFRKSFSNRSKVGSNNSRYDSIPYCFYNIETGEKITMPCWDFCKEFNLRRKPIRAVAKGQRAIYKGWKLF